MDFHDLNFRLLSAVPAQELQTQQSSSTREQMNVHVVHGERRRHHFIWAAQIMSMISVIRGWFMTKFYGP